MCGSDNHRDRPAGNRGVAGMLDFLTAMVIVLGALGVYFTAAAALVDVQRDTGSPTAHTGLRAQERLVDDALQAGAGNDTLSPGCVRSFFTGTANRSCGVYDHGNGQAFLRGALGIGDRYVLNVTMRNGSGPVTIDPSGGSDPYRHAVGRPVPHEGPVTVYDRTVTFGDDVDGDGRPDYYTVTLRLWEGAT